ncbi:MAG: glycosyltransferase [Bacteroidota bacterium]
MKKEKLKNSIGDIYCSVIIPTYNRSQLLDFTLSSLTFQSIPSEKFEVIVVDDGSSDNTFEVIQKYQDRLRVSYYFQEDLGYRVASARNLAIKHSQADICVFIDSGIIVNNNFLGEHLLNYQNSSSRVAVIGSVYGFCDDLFEFRNLGKLIDKHSDLEELFQIVRTKKEYKDVREPFFEQYNYRLELMMAPWIYYWTGNASFAKSSLPEGEETFDAIFDYNHGYEDVDLGYRLFRNGVKILFNGKAESIHYPHDKIENFRTMQLTNANKFHEKFQTTESKLVMDLALSGTNDLDFNKYLIERTKQSQPSV